MTTTDRIAMTASGGLRSWQLTALDGIAQWRSGSYLISAAPGAGKTRPAIEAARRMLRAGAIDRVIVVCPTAPLTRQWAQAAGEHGLELLPDAEDAIPPRDFDGIVVTYAKIASVAARWAPHISARTLVVADEVHHLGDELAWGEGFALAFAAAERRLLLSGTPFRSDTTPIPGVRYDADGVAVADISYTYADAVRDGICRPVHFIPYDGTLTWQSGDDVIEAGFDTALPAREASRRYRTAISTDLAEGLPRILAAAHEKLRAVRAGGHRDAGGLVIAADSTHARKIAKLLREVSGTAPTVVLHAEAGAHRNLAEFTRSRREWIVAVNMVSEGVDIPRLRVGVYAGAAKTALLFRQVVGRFVRTIPGRPPEASWLYLPGDAILRRHASQVDGELRHIIRRPDGDEGLLDEPPERRESERGETSEFSPLTADVATQTQMSLFAEPQPQTLPPPPAATAAIPIASPKPALWESGDSAEVTAPPPVPKAGPSAFQRRKLLREKRHRLVADLGRRERRSHREINAWLNREAGITRVQDATLEQLERCIDLLLDALSGRASGPR